MSGAYLVDRVELTLSPRKRGWRWWLRPGINEQQRMRLPVWHLMVNEFKVDGAVFTFSAWVRAER